MIWSLSPVSCGEAMEQHPRPSVSPSPTKPTQPYGGETKNNFNKKVRVSSCVSLGGNCIQRINSIISDADEFIVSFMYRFDSPTLIRTLGNKYINSNTPVIVFLDYNQLYKSTSTESNYFDYVKELINSVPTSLVKLASRSFHHKVTISKQKNKEAIVIIGSANATYASDNQNSEDVIFIQSNELAKFYLTEFETLLRYDPAKNRPDHLIRESKVKVFHEHRLQPSLSNTEALKSFIDLLNNPTDAETLTPYHKGTIKTVALSTGHPTEKGTIKCLNIVQQALANTANTALFLFENYITLDNLKAALRKGIVEGLVNHTPKFIVVEDNEHNKGLVPSPEETNNNNRSKKSTSLLKKPNTQEKRESVRINMPANHILLFRPFTGYKFHHKLILQYLKTEEPIVYTGSFHISSNAVNNNSETIIGIQSQDLANEILSSLLLNSGLGEKPEIWNFIIQHLSSSKEPSKVQSQSKLQIPPQVKSATNTNTRLQTRSQTNSKTKTASPLPESLASSHPQTELQSHFKINLTPLLHHLSSKVQKNMERYADRFEKICEELLEAASAADEQEAIKTPFKPLLEKFIKEKNYEEPLTQIDTLKTTIFKNPSFYEVWSSHLNSLYKRIVQTKKGNRELYNFPHYSLESYPSYQTWLEEFKEWLDWEIGLSKITDDKIKEELESMSKLYYALHDLDEYEESYGKLVELKETLDKVMLHK